jgi:pimeloyl-ACP methyl ester carboxylesterase
VSRITLLTLLLVPVVLVLAVLVAALCLAAAPGKPVHAPADVFGFATSQAPDPAGLPPIRRYIARDGEPLPYLFYDSKAERVLIFIHGSSYHGGGYHTLARALSEAGVAKVVLPTLRGHYLAGQRRGDVDYIGQLEDDIADLAGALRSQGLKGPFYLGGHSSGGGFALRFAGGEHGALMTGYLLLSPAIPPTDSMRYSGTAGGWANLNLKRFVGLMILGRMGIHGFDGLPVISFNKPVACWDGTETLSYSYRLNAACHPRIPCTGDMQALGAHVAVFVGDRDEAIDADKLRALFAKDAPGVPCTALPGITHFGIFSESGALKAVGDWLATQP